MADDPTPDEFAPGRVVRYDEGFHRALRLDPPPASTDDPDADDRDFAVQSVRDLQASLEERLREVSSI